jgi:hypothetical protein
MRFKLNGWHRLGVILSVLWIIGGGLWATHQQAASESPEYSDTQASLCRRDFTDADQISACENKYHKEYLHMLSVAIIVYR